MKLYFAPGACSLAVRITLNELNQSFTSIKVDLSSKKTEDGKDFLAINPKACVPTLVLDNGEMLTEGAAIQQFIAESHPSNLLPTVGNFNRYRVLEWLTFVSTDLHKGCAPMFNASMPKDVQKNIFIPALLNKLKIVEHQLETNEFLTGKNFTIADSYLFVTLSWLSHFNVNINEMPHISRYFNQIKQRPSVVKSLSEEGLKF